ncbi:MAG: hypothetical protein PVH41_12830 [Anaerolineae bacterium]|jgi:hypothetical protein
MRQAMVMGRADEAGPGVPVVAGPDSPDVAVCPSCGAVVHKRHRRCMDKTITWYYRHARGAGKRCPQRYRPCR